MKDRFEELAEIWFKKASDDLIWAKHDFAGGFYGMVCFGCQQIGEKALKAYLFFKKQKLIRTHNLERLLEKCISFEKEFIVLKRNCQVLTKYYTDTRYPDIWDATRFENKKLANEALDLAKKIITFVEKQIIAK